MANPDRYTCQYNTEQKSCDFHSG